MNTKQQFGRWGEKMAENFLLSHGYVLLGRNVHTPYGEIDLVLRQEGITVFVEVKTRSSKKFGFPEQSITASKQTHLIEAAQHYIQEHQELGGDWRIDVIAIQYHTSQQSSTLKHFENAVY